MLCHASRTIVQWEAWVAWEVDELAAVEAQIRRKIKNIWSHASSKNRFYPFKAKGWFRFSGA